MARLGKDPATGMITLDGVPLDRYDPRLWGSSGRNVMNTRDAQGRNITDPRYYYQNGSGTDSEGGGGMDPTYALRPEYAQRVGNRTQLGQAGVGGYGEITDEGLANATYDDEFGILADPNQIGAPDDRISRIAGPLIMAAFGGAAMSGMGLGGTSGASGGSSGQGLLGGFTEGSELVGNAIGNGTLNSTAALESAGLGGAGAAGAGALPGVGQVAGLGGAATTPWYQGLLDRGIGAVTNNPLGAASTLMQGAGLVGGLLGGGRGGGSSGGSTFRPAGGLLGGGTGGQQGAFKPNAVMAAQLQRLYGRNINGPV